MDAKHADLITDRILDAVAIAGTAEEAVPRFRQLIELGVEDFVLPIATENPGEIIRTLAHEVLPHLATQSTP
jgi:alkanesulfonate monooxygenase SsuD/methylene tetrahydromethanopterin reductase-like flavin-dependent oxidoreductase (luciferase family)